MPISTMKKLTVFAPRSDADAIVRKLLRLKCVQIRRLKNPDGNEMIPADTNGSGRAELEAKLQRIRAALPILSRYSRRPFRFARLVHRVDRSEFLSQGRDALAMKTAEHVLEIHAAVGRLESEQTYLKETMQALLPWLGYDAPLSFTGSRHTSVMLGCISAKEIPMPELVEAGACVEVVSGEAGTWYLAVTSHREDFDAVMRTLLRSGFVKASFDGEDTTAQGLYDACEARLERLEDELLQCTDRLTDLSDGLDDLEILSDIEETNLNVLLQKQKLLNTRSCSILSGWIPAEAVDAMTEALSSTTCAVEVLDPDEDDEVPVKLKNGPISTTFEWVIGMYSYPKYGTFDPTLIMSIFYFLIFGMMFADVGYGLLLVLGCFGGVKLLNPREGMKRMLLMFGYCGISCMLMGVLFGGWFGNLPTAIMNSFFPIFEGKAEQTPIGSFFYNGLIFNPVDSSTGFLVLSLAMGEIHLIAGMAINLIETWKSGSRLEAICSNVPIWILFIGIDLLAPSAIFSMLIPGAASESTMALFATLSDIGLYVTLAGFASILLVTGLSQKSFFAWLVKGLGGLYSLIGLASDLLSYSRILALGLVAGVISQVINMLTGLGATGPLGFVFMLIVMIAGHVLNLAINLLGTFVHAARLQYIEFFGKFYVDGGEPFTPETPSEVYSEDL